MDRLKGWKQRMAGQQGKPGRAPAKEVSHLHSTDGQPKNVAITDPGAKPHGKTELKEKPPEEAPEKEADASKPGFNEKKERSTTPNRKNGNGKARITQIVTEDDVKYIEYFVRRVNELRKIAKEKKNNIELLNKGVLQISLELRLDQGKFSLVKLVPKADGKPCADDIIRRVDKLLRPQFEKKLNELDKDFPESKNDKPSTHLFNISLTYDASVLEVPSADSRIVLDKQENDGEAAHRTAIISLGEFCKIPSKELSYQFYMPDFDQPGKPKRFRISLTDEDEMFYTISFDWMKSAGELKNVARHKVGRVQTEGEEQFATPNDEFKIIFSRFRTGERALMIEPRIPGEESQPEIVEMPVGYGQEKASANIAAYFVAAPLLYSLVSDWPEYVNLALPIGTLRIGINAFAIWVAATTGAAIAAVIGTGIIGRDK